MNKFGKTITLILMITLLVTALLIARNLCVNRVLYGALVPVIIVVWYIIISVVAYLILKFGNYTDYPIISPWVSASLPLILAIQWLCSVTSYLNIFPIVGVIFSIMLWTLCMIVLVLLTIPILACLAYDIFAAPFFMIFDSIDNERPIRHIISISVSIISLVLLTYSIIILYSYYII